MAKKQKLVNVLIGGRKEKLSQEPFYGDVIRCPISKRVLVLREDKPNGENWIDAKWRKELKERFYGRCIKTPAEMFELEDFIINILNKNGTSL